MEILKLFYNKKRNKYYHLGACSCDKCNIKINDIVYIVSIWNRKKSNLKRYCMGCFGVAKKKIPDIAKETKWVMIKQILPKDTVPILLRPPFLVSYRGGMSPFEAAEPKNCVGVEVIDRTKLANRTDEVLALEVKQQKKIAYTRINELDKPVHNISEYVRGLTQ